MPKSIPLIPSLINSIRERIGDMILTTAAFLSTLFILPIEKKWLLMRVVNWVRNAIINANIRFVLVKIDFDESWINVTNNTKIIIKVNETNMLNILFVLWFLDISFNSLLACSSPIILGRENDIPQ